MRLRRSGEWPFVAGLVVAVGLFGASHLAGATTNRVDGSLRMDSGVQLHGTSPNAHVDDVNGASKIVVVGSRHYSIVGSSHSPRAGEPWTIALTATKGGRPLKGRIRADALLNGTAVRHIADKALVAGVYTTSFPWPANSVGIGLALRFTIDDGTVSESFVYGVRVRPAHG